MEPGYTQPSLGNLSTSWPGSMYGGSVVSCPTASFYYEGFLGGRGGHAADSGTQILILEGYPPIHSEYKTAAAGSTIEYSPSFGGPEVEIRVPQGGGTVIIPVYT